MKSHKLVRKGPRRFTIAGGLSILLAASAGIVASSGAGAETAGAPVGGPTTTAAHLAETANAIVAAVAGKYATTFGGLYVDENASAIHVLFTQDAPQRASELQGLADNSVTIIPDSVTYSLAQLTTEANAIEQDEQSLATVGVKIEGVGPDQRSNDVSVVIDYGILPSAASAMLSSRYAGGPPISVTQMRIVPTATEYSNGPPWLAGFQLNSPNVTGLAYNECTEGFNVKVQGTSGNASAYVSTAGHCFPSNTSVYHGLGSGSFGFSGQYIGGTGVTGFFNGSSADFESVSPVFAGTPGTAVVNHNESINVWTFASYVFQGNGVCKSGLTTGETCSNQVIESSQQACYPQSSGPPVCINGMEWTQSTPGAVYYGDSGGPVYLYQNNSNIVAAGWTSGLGLNCDSSGNNCTPNGIMIFTPVGNVQSQFNMRPISTIGG